ncbi:hypothetical protein J2Y58_001338 [Sphingomonas sp. BE138]|uniref:hypothetical protein n=1 Tax=Sphingomonas sp. BE138 TaxID=2817845 RepID=UPI0028569711|nr:hypothetical protein [Sphingomonas sp. BE138]MDR6787986.1 hypothetical protein [Sphingomonas sp. BE138]
MIADASSQMMLSTPVERSSEGIIFGKMMVIGWPENDRSAPLVIWNNAATQARLRHDMVDPKLPPQELSCRLHVAQLVDCSRSRIGSRIWKHGYLPILTNLRLDRDYVRHLRPTPTTRIAVQITFDDRDCPLAITCTGTPAPPPPLPPED